MGGLAERLAWYGFCNTAPPTPTRNPPSARFASLTLGGALAPGFALRARAAAGGLGGGCLGGHEDTIHWRKRRGRQAKHLAARSREMRGVGEAGFMGRLGHGRAFERVQQRGA